MLSRDGELNGKLPSTVKDSMLLKLDDAMKETMRLYPAVLIVVRKADEGVSGQLVSSSGNGGNGKTLRCRRSAGIWISPYVMGRLPRHWGGDAGGRGIYRPSRGRS